ncbi:unnamed protein product, partial [marine sediment metagenome]
ITLLTQTGAASATGVTATTNTCGFTPVAGLCTIYARSGANAGVYRVTDGASATAQQWDVAMPNDTAV